MTNGTLRLQWDPKSKALSAKLDDTVIHVDHGNLLKEKFRHSFAEALASKAPAIPPTEICTELIRPAGKETQKGAGQPASAVSSDDFDSERKEHLVPASRRKSASRPGRCWKTPTCSRGSLWVLRRWAWPASINGRR